MAITRRLFHRLFGALVPTLVAEARAESLGVHESKAVDSVAQLRSFWSEAELVFCKGYAEADDGGGGIFFWSPDDDRADDGATIVAREGSVRGRWVRHGTSGEIDVRWFGARGDGRTDDTTAFERARDFARSRSRKEPQLATDPLGSVKIRIPAGTYLITRPEAMLDRAWPSSTLGLTFEGLGPGISAINYRPAQPGALMFNNNAVLFLRISGILFACNDGKSTFYESVSTAKAQDVRCENVAWNGAWSIGFRLTGSNTNSEYKWSACSIAGSWEYFLDLDGNDQLLNYWFLHCKFWATKGGGWVRARHGGHIKISDCDVSGWTETQGRPLFALLGTTHARGVCHFQCVGSRFEIKTDSAPVLHSQWPHGVISFANADFGSQAPWRSGDYIEAVIEIGSAGHAVLHWQDCTHLGRHSYRPVGASTPTSTREIYRFLTDPLRRRARVIAKYEGCTHLSASTPNEMIILDRSLLNTSACPNITFDQCRSEKLVEGRPILEWNSDFTWSAASPSVAIRKVSSIALLEGGTSEPVTYFLPGAIMTKVQLYLLREKRFNSDDFIRVAVKAKIVCEFTGGELQKMSLVRDGLNHVFEEGNGGLLSVTVSLADANKLEPDRPWGRLLIDFLG